MQYEEEFVVIQLVTNILLQIELQYLVLFEIVFQEDIEQLLITKTANLSNRLLYRRY